MSGVQLRRYEIKPGEMDAFLDAWRGILPVREKFGFSVVCAFADAEGSEFTWVVRHDGDFPAAEKDYYASPDRAAATNPAAHVAAAHVAMVSPELPSVAP